MSWILKHKIVSAIAALVILVIIGSSLGGKSNTSSSTTVTQASSTATTVTATSQASTTSTPPAMPKIGQPVSDGKFQFTITAFKCGISQITQVDDQYEVATAQGQFCTMNLTIKNTGNQAQSFDDSSQYIYDAAGKQYNDSTNGTIAANPSNSQFDVLPNVNPGISVSGVLAFDIPKGVVPTYAILHDSMFSGGAKVSLQ